MKQVRAVVEKVLALQNEVNMSWLKDKMQDVREIAVKPVIWAKANRYKPLIAYVEVKNYLTNAIKKAEDEKKNQDEE